MSHVDEGTLHAYLDGELPSTERATFEAHLAQCEACRARLVDERALRERSAALLGAARPVEHAIPPFEQLHRKPKRSPWRVRTSFAWAASIALALGLGYYINGIGARRMPGETVATPTVVAHKDEAQNQVVAPPPAAFSESRVRPSRNAPRQETAEHDQRKPATDSALASVGRVDSGTLKVAVRAAPRIPSPEAVAATAPPQADSADVVSRQAPALAAQLQRGEVLAERKVSTSTWPRIDRQTAKTILGEDPVGLPDLTTRSYRRSPDREGMVVVEQFLDDRTVIQIFQQQTARANARFDSLAFGTRGAAISSFDRERADRLARFVGKLRVEIGGPVSVDSLNRLLEQVGRLP